MMTVKHDGAFACVAHAWHCAICAHYCKTSIQTSIAAHVACLSVCPLLSQVLAGLDGEPTLHHSLCMLSLAETVLVSYLYYMLQDVMIPHMRISPPFLLPAATHRHRPRLQIAQGLL